ncbi:hypothetical protein B0H19DRAFT_1251168 [Mycena capillaripes]|nr:hypothetical protein B0H19DRAFT_1251168 [Mycena capillaripes]
MASSASAASSVSSAAPDRESVLTSARRSSRSRRRSPRYDHYHRRAPQHGSRSRSWSWSLVSESHGIPSVVPQATLYYGDKPNYTNDNTVPYSSSTTNLPLPSTSSSSNRKLSFSLQRVVTVVFFLLFDSFPRQLYLHLLLRIPSLYFSRVTRIFEDARLSLPDIKRMARAKADQWHPESFVWQPFHTPDQMPLPRSLLQFRSSWESFIDSLMREWKTLNIISVLLMSAILTMLQIEAASHPITRTSALFSLICALMSLLYGCMYIIRFGTMRKMHKASSFANEAQRGTTSIWWNVWVLLAMPAVWLAWSIITFLTCIMSFIWLSGSTQDPVDFAVSPRAALGPRIGLTVVFSLGLIYFVLIVRTFHRYGDPLDREWMRTVNQWTKEALATTEALGGPSQTYPHPGGGPFYSRPPPSRSSRFAGRSPPVIIPRSFSEEGEFTKIPPSNPLTTHPSAFFRRPGPTAFVPEPVTIMQLGHPDVQARKAAYANPKWAAATTADDWSRFMLDISSAWNGQLSLSRADAAAAIAVDLPAYTLLSLARPDNPIPTSVESSGEFVVGPQRNRSITSSESSYARVKPSAYMDSGSSPPGAIAPGPSSAEHEPKTFAQHPASSSSPTTQSPADGAGAGISPPPLPGVQDQSDPVQTVREFLELWNERYFHPRHLEVSLVPQRDLWGSLAVNLASWSRGPVANDDTAPNIGNRSVGEELSASLSEMGSELRLPSPFTAAEDARDPAT